MFLTLFYYIFIIIVSLALLFNVFMFCLATYYKLKYEPTKGMCKSNARLDGKIALVTGGNQGIGLETARDLASRNATVIIACRDGKRAAKAIADMIKTTGNDKIEYKYLNLASFGSIRNFAKNFKNTYDRLDILVNNAGCAGLKHKMSEDGIEIVLQINYLGPFLLTNLLLDRIKASEAGRIVIVSSLAHLFGSPVLDKLNGGCEKHTLLKYSNSKLCQVMWMKALAKRLPSNVTVNSVHPGLVKTDIFHRMPPLWHRWFMFIVNLFNFKTPVEGAQTSIHLAACEEVQGITGKHFMECKEGEYSQSADNDELVDKMWEESVKLTN